MAGSILPTCVDVSEHQGEIIWAQTKDGLWMAILRVQDGTYADIRLSRNVKYCEQLGIPYYCYGFYRNGGAVEANRMVSRYKATGGKQCRGFIIDTEVTGFSKANLRSAFAALRQAMPDGKHGHYIANHLWSEYGGEQYGEDWRWVPVYGVNDGYAHIAPAHKCDLWQFTSAGRVPGISGNVDCNAIVSDDKSVAWFTDGTPPQQKPSAPADGVEQFDLTLEDYKLVALVMTDESCTGDVRRAALGSRYDEIQALINHILRSSATTLAREVMEGRYGNGPYRHDALGPRYDEVQEKVMQIYYGSPAKTYTVKSGDTLSEIGAKLGVAWKDIAAKNGISSPYTIYPGQVLEV
ncbi:LysM peptidoglycan-binding domain-containing protein [Collinsella aerofaciens]|uniref:LysM peptidoglycan-binding domain-containing protein n=1 Tax=Collinsella aerofaciens TaxID=74426 RepID=A0A6N9JJD0_9ACTN|nr:LysM peptidoglycan-binding domain-containing protein [Collinsella aerofaciens]MZJ39529.1 LysM peptidoglycan-binding domain-containing protein [Collinsella aerofaciens]